MSYIIRSLVLMGAMVGVLFATAQETKLDLDDPRTWSQTIQEEDLKDHLTTLASDAYEGRETGTEGQKKAARYIADHFKKLDLQPVGDDGTYFQKILFVRESWDDVNVRVNGKDYRHLWDYYAFQSINAELPELETDKIIFLGYGIDDENYSDYKGRNLEGKVILVYTGEPLKEDSTSWITGTQEMSRWSHDLSLKLNVAKEHGVSAVLFIDRQFTSNLNRFRRFILNPRLTMKESTAEEESPFPNSIFISGNMARDIFGKKTDKVIRLRDKITRKGKPKKTRLKADFRLEMSKEVEKIISENVVGYIEGTDPALKDEVIVLSAHYDHLGKRGGDIWNGANDNASGTTSVLEITEALALARQKEAGPKRPVLAILFTGEEKGLLGSKYYSENPIIPLENTMVNINVDMVGRVDVKHKDDPDYIYVIGADRLSTDLHRVNEEANAKYAGFSLDYTYNEDDDPNRYYYRSDHYNFAKNGIPAIFYFNGTHDDYHRPTDTVDKIRFDVLEKVTRLIFHTSWELAMRKDPIEVDVNVEGTK